MKPVLMIVVLGIIVCFGSGCTTVYWTDRARDAGDVFTITGGYGLGARAQAGPFVAGVSYYSDVVGIRCGDYGFYLDRKIYDDAGFEADVCVIFVAGDRFETDVTNARRKTIDAGTPIVEVIPFILSIPLPFVELQDGPATTRSWSYYTQFEVTAACGGGVRLGFNPGELIDLLLGFVGIDVYGDDLERRKRVR